MPPDPVWGTDVGAAVVTQLQRPVGVPFVRPTLAVPVDGPGRNVHPRPCPGSLGKAGGQTAGGEGVASGEEWPWGQLGGAPGPRSCSWGQGVRPLEEGPAEPGGALVVGAGCGPDAGVDGLPLRGPHALAWPSAHSTASPWCPWRHSPWSSWSRRSTASAATGPSAPAGSGLGGGAERPAAQWPGRGTHACAPRRAACLPSRFPKPPQPIILRDCQVLPLPPGLPLTLSQELTPGAPPPGPQPRPPTAVAPDAEPTLLQHPQVRTQAWGQGRGQAGLPRGPPAPPLPACSRTAPLPAGNRGLRHARARLGPLRLPAAQLPARPPQLHRGGPRQRRPRLAG